jgi:DNA-binding transcriptional regulator YhcF (GntR family)
MFVLQLMAFKWNQNAPFPSYSTLAKRMNITHKQVRRYAKALEDKGFLRRTARIGSSNSFDLQPLFDALAGALKAEKLPKAA